jgi:hypothetical protein
MQGGAKDPLAHATARRTSKMDRELLRWTGFLRHGCEVGYLCYFSGVESESSCAAPPRRIREDRPP